MQPPRHYGDDAVVEVVGEPGRHLTVKRTKLICRWDLADQLVADDAAIAASSHAEEVAQQKAEKARRVDEALRAASFIQERPGATEPSTKPHEKVATYAISTKPMVVVRQPIAYTIDEAAEAVGYSATTIRNAIRKGYLTPSYGSASKPVILATELQRWLEQSPAEPW